MDKYDMAVHTSANDVHSNEDVNDIKSIISHKWVDGKVELKGNNYTSEEEYHHFDLIQANDLLATTHYLIKNHQDSCIPCCYGRWAHCFLRQLSAIMDEYGSPPIGTSPRRKGNQRLRRGTEKTLSMALNCQKILSNLQAVLDSLSG